MQQFRNIPITGKNQVNMTETMSNCNIWRQVKYCFNMLYKFNNNKLLRDTDSSGF